MRGQEKKEVETLPKDDTLYKIMKHPRKAQRAELWAFEIIFPAATAMKLSLSLLGFAWVYFAWVYFAFFTCVALLQTYKKRK